MVINRIICTSKILTTKQSIKTKNTFAKAVCALLVVKMCWQNIKKVAWALMVHNLSD